MLLTVRHCVWDPENVRNRRKEAIRSAPDRFLIRRVKKPFCAVFQTFVNVYGTRKGPLLLAHIPHCSGSRFFDRFCTIKT